MEKVKLDKVRLALAQMDDKYWDCVVSNMSALENHARQVAAAFLDGYRVLMEAQIEVIEARYGGYQQIIGSDEASLPEIVKTSKNQLAQLEAKKNQAASEISGLLEGLQSVVVLAQTLGEPSPSTQKGSGGH